MPNRFIETLKRWKYPPRRTDIQLPMERGRDPRLPATDTVEEQVAELAKRRRLLSKLGQ